MVGERSSSEPPPDGESIYKSGLRGGFPIKINGFELGSQENLQDCGRQSREASCDRWGPRVKSRQGSVGPESPSVRRMSLRGTTPVPSPSSHSSQSQTSPQKSELDFSTPFGPTQRSRRSCTNQSLVKSHRSYSQTSLHTTNTSQDTTIFSQDTTTSSLDTTTTTQDTKDSFAVSSSHQNSEVSTMEISQTHQTSSNGPPDQRQIQDHPQSSPPCTLNPPPVIQTSVTIIIPSSMTSSSTNSCCTIDNSTPCSTSSVPPSSTPQFNFQRPRQFHPSSYSGPNTANTSPYIAPSIPPPPPNQTCSTQSHQLQHAICNMTETLSSFKADVMLVDEERAEHVEAALQSMKENLEVLREPSQQPGHNLEDVIGNMKDTLKAIRNDVNHKTLKELNREMTPFDLPALSPVPQKAEERKPAQYSVSETIRKDRVMAHTVLLHHGPNQENNIVKEETKGVGRTAGKEIKKGSKEQVRSRQEGEHIGEGFGERGTEGEEKVMEVEQAEIAPNIESSKQQTPESSHPCQNRKSSREAKENEERVLAEINDLGMMKPSIPCPSSSLPQPSKHGPVSLRRVVSIGCIVTLPEDRSGHEILQTGEKGQQGKEGETGDIKGKHREVVTACIQELEDSSCVDNDIQISGHPVLPCDSVSSSCPLLESASTFSCFTTTEEDTTAKDTGAEETETEEEQEADRKEAGGLFLTECSQEGSKDSETNYSFLFNIEDVRGKKEVGRTGQEKRKRRRTIDYHDLRSTQMYECSDVKVRDYHEKKYEEPSSSVTTGSVGDRVEIAKDGLGLILQRLHNIESKLDNLKNMETSVLGQDICTTRRYSLPGRLSNVTPVKPLELGMGEGDTEREGKYEVDTEYREGGGSDCSTPTIMEPKQYSKVQGYESDDTEVPDSDCDAVIDDKSEDEYGEMTYRHFPIDVNIEEVSSDEDPESRQKRIESLASSITIPSTARGFQRPEMNMDIDTLSERSEEEGEEETRPRVRNRKPSGRKRSLSRDRNVAKIRYCWRCHHAGHENWQCEEDVQPGGWCPRCLETSHWEDACWVEAAHVLCPICSIPGHLPCVHQATDFRQRKLVIDTFGWLAFREWFQDMTFRSWWNCSGFTGVPLYKIMQRNPSQDLDLGFEEQ